MIDTAECYEDSEELIGSALGARRGEYYLFTKCGHARGECARGLAAGGLLRSIERSLKRLRTDRVDLVQLHSCSLDVLKRGDAIAALERRASAAGPATSATAATARRAVGGGDRPLRHAPDLGQHRRSGGDRPDAAARARRRWASSPSGPSPTRPGATRASRPSPTTRTTGSACASWTIPFLRGKGDGAVQTALRFTLGVPGVHTAIVGTTKPDRWRENAALLGDGPLPEAEREGSARAGRQWRGRTGRARSDGPGLI